MDIVLEKFNLHIEHGHEIAPTLSTHYPELTNKYNYIIKAGFILEDIGFSLLGPRVFVPINYISRQLKQSAKKNKQEILVCGHSHLAEFLPKQNYINTGVINYNIGQYLLVDEDLHSINERY